MAKKAKSRAGRKRDPNKKVMFSTRLEPQVLAKLKIAAQTWPGNNVSTLAESLINRGLQEREDRARDPAMRAMCFLISEIAHQIVGAHLFDGKSEKPIFNWRSDPFFYRAFKIAVSRVLDNLDPPGEIKPPIMRSGDETVNSLAWFKSFASPEARAEYSVDYVLYALRERLSPEEYEKRKRILNSVGVPSFLREFYGMPDAARDLEPKSLTRKAMKDVKLFQHKLKG